MEFKPLTSMEEWTWMKERTHTIRCEDTQGIVALDRVGAIAAICVADSFSPDSCCVHLCIDNPLVIRSGFLHEVARHLFITCGRSHIFGNVPSTNQKALRFDKHIGFEEVCRIPDGVGTGVDYIVLRMDKATCPWLNEEQKREAA